MRKAPRCLKYNEQKDQKLKGSMLSDINAEQVNILRSKTNLEACVVFLGVMQKVKMELGVWDSKGAVVGQEMGQHHVAIVISAHKRVHPDL